MTDAELKQRLDKMDERVEKGFAALSEEFNSLFRNGPISKLQNEMAVLKTRLSITTAILAILGTAVVGYALERIF